jgi:LPXTG-motif cell wall-anchored protein
MTKTHTGHEDAVLEVRWTEGSKQNQCSGEILPCALEFHVLQGASQNNSYRFVVTLAAEAAEVVGSISDQASEQATPKAKSTLPRTGGTVYLFYLVGMMAVVFGVLLRRKH